MDPEITDPNHPDYQPPADPNNPPIDPPVDPPKEPDETTLYRQALVEQQELIRSQSDSIDSMRNELAAVNARVTDATKPAELSIEDRNKEYYENPTVAVTEIVKKQLNETIAPVVNDFRAFTQKQQYAEAKELFKKSESYKTIFPHIEQIVDGLYNSGKVELGSIKLVVDNIIGQVYTGQLKLPNFNPAAPVAPINPPHVKPSNPGAPNKNPPAGKEDDESQYTETTRMLARKYGMTPKEFVELSKEGDMVVTTSTKRKENV